VFGFFYSVAGIGSWKWSATDQPGLGLFEGHCFPFVLLDVQQWLTGNLAFISFHIFLMHSVDTQISYVQEVKEPLIIFPEPKICHTVAL
jgi:hypothetical protein